MPASPDVYPSRNEVIDYLTRYEQRYQFPIRRPVHVEAVSRTPEGLLVTTNHGEWLAQAVVSATGTWSAPYIPDYPGREVFRGRQIHSAQYRNPEDVRGEDVLVVGGGNSGAQILAEVSTVSQATWVTLHEPMFLSDDVDGRVLFERATARWKALRDGTAVAVPVGGLGDIVMVSSVREARERDVLHTVRPFSRFEAHGVVWADGTRAHVDTVIWCTGFHAALGHLDALQIRGAEGSIATDGTRAKAEPRLWLVGYGDWCGAASATLIGVMRSARDAAQGIAQHLRSLRQPAGPASP
jgi:putative flavoprotein involved in K+ transport